MAGAIRTSDSCCAVGSPGKTTSLSGASSFSFSCLASSSCLACLQLWVQPRVHQLFPASLQFVAQKTLVLGWSRLQAAFSFAQCCFLCLPSLVYPNVRLREQRLPYLQNCENVNLICYQLHFLYLHFSKIHLCSSLHRW